MNPGNLGRDWSLASGGKSIRAGYLMKDFTSAVELIGRIAELAQRHDHHPDLHLTGYRRLEVELTTHSAGGLTDKDFALAAAIEALPKALKRP